MKTLALIALPALAGAAALHSTSFDKRQGLFATSVKGTPLRPILVKKLSPTIDSSGKAIRELGLWGPFPLQAANATHANKPGEFKLDANSDILSGQMSGLCANCMILEAKADLADKDGKKIDIGEGVYSHHIIISDVGRTSVVPGVKAVCANGLPGGFNFQLAGGMMGGKKPDQSAPMAGMLHSGHSRRQVPPKAGTPPTSVFIGQGDEGSAMTFQMPKGTIKSGFYVAEKEVMMMMAEVINYNKSPREIYISLEYEYLPNLPKKPADYHDVGMGAINVSPCQGESMNLMPPKDKAVKYTSPPWLVTSDGYLVNVKPHLHDGGVNMTFFVNGKEACSSQAVYGGTDGGLKVGEQKWETITAYTPCDHEIKVTTNDKLTMEAWYDLSKHRL